MRLLTSLFSYQQAAVEKLLHVKVGALYMEMGTGKTRTALELIQRRLETGKVSQVLWLCPYSVQRDLPELLSEHIDTTENIRIAGIESLSSSLRLYGELLQYVKTSSTFLIVDESLLVKNPFAYRTMHIVEISKHCAYKLILNGTPISRNEADLFSQWYVLDWRILGYQSYYSFSANHLEMDSDYPGKVRRILNTDYLARKIAPYTYECSKASVLELPPKQYYTKSFWLTDEQQIHYDEIGQILINQMDERKPATVYRLFGAMQAITSGFGVALNDTRTHNTLFRFLPPEDNPRLIALNELLNEIGNEQAVIYCHYTQEIEDILAILGSKALPFYGEMKQSSRQENKTAFKEGYAQYLVANKSCAQFGLNLQFCHNEVFYNNDWDWGTRAQAEDRLHRAGQTHPVKIYDIFAERTIDVTIQKCLCRKERMSDIFKEVVRSHNSTKDFIKAALLGQLEGGKNGEDIPR